MDSRLSTNFADPGEVIRQMSEEDKVQVVGMWLHEKLVVPGKNIVLAGFVPDGYVLFYQRKMDDDRGEWHRCLLDQALALIILRTSPRRDPAEPTGWKGFFNKPRPNPPQ